MPQEYSETFQTSLCIDPERLSPIWLKNLHSYTVQLIMLFYIISLLFWLVFVISKIYIAIVEY